MVRRVLIPIVVGAAALALAYRLCMPELQCNRAWAVMNQANKDALDLDDYRATLLVRGAIPTAIPCTDQGSTNVFMMYDLAEGYRRLGRHEDAVAVLTRALRYDRRPELFISLGDSLAQLGRLEDGLAMMRTGARFYGKDEGRINYVMHAIAYRDIVKDRMRAAGEL